MYIYEEGEKNKAILSSSKYNIPLSMSHSILMIKVEKLPGIGGIFLKDGDAK